MGSNQELTGMFGLSCDVASPGNDPTDFTCYTHLPNGSGQVIGETIDSTSYYYLPDLQGSTVDVTDVYGNIADTYSYDPYGNLLGSTGTVANPWMFDDGYYDSSTGLYRFGERYYNPADGRWTQLDPSGQDPGYIFAADDPVNIVDPSGTSSLSKFLKAYAVGCGAGLAATLGYAIDTAYATGGQVEISGLELLLGCSVAGGGAAQDSISSNGGIGYHVLDAALVLLRL